MLNIFKFCRQWLNKLPDKGKKIQELYDRVVTTLEYKNEIHKTANLLSSLSLGSNNLNNLEWEGTTEPQKKQQLIDSDDDEAEDPLEILVSSNSVYGNKKIIKNNTSDDDRQTLITEQDIKEAKEILNEKLRIDPVLEKICKLDNLDTPFRFLPHKSTEQPCPIKKKEINYESESTMTGKKRCEAISLAESFLIEHESQKARQELLEKQAIERLEAKKKELESVGLKLSEPPKNIPTMTKYRLPPEEFDEYVRQNDDEDLSEDTLSDDDINDDEEVGQ